jgi:hypothetical protein
MRTYGGGSVRRTRNQREGRSTLLGGKQRGRRHRQYRPHILQLSRLLQHLGAVSAEPQSLDPTAYVLTVEDRGFFLVTSLTLHDGIPF